MTGEDYLRKRADLLHRIETARADRSYDHLSVLNRALAALDAKYPLVNPRGGGGPAGRICRFEISRD